MIGAQAGAPVEHGDLAASRTAMADREQVLEELVEQYGDSVLHLAYLHLKDRGLAEDVFQEVFTRVYFGLDRFRGEASPRTWIYRITVNLCRDKLRSPALRRVLLLGAEVLEHVRPALVDTAAADAADELLAAADRNDLLAAVMALPLAYREVVLLYYYESLDIREVGEALSLSQGTVRSRLHRARARLKALLERGGFERESYI